MMAHSVGSTLPPVLVIGLNTAGLAVVRAFQGSGIQCIGISYDHKDMGRVSHGLHRLIQVAHPETQEGRFVEQMLALGRDYPGAVVFPSTDPALVVTARHREELSTAFRVGCAASTVVDTLIQKRLTYEVAGKCGVPAPRTFIPKTEAQAVRYGEEIGYPCLVKPDQSHLYFDKLLRKMVLAGNMDEVLEAYREAAGFGLAVMLQEFIPGGDDQGVNFNSLYVNGEPLVEFTAQKIRNAPPSLGSPCVVRSEVITGVVDSARKMLKALQYTGFSCMEFKLDRRDGIHKLMEINGRHNLSGLLAIRSGINFPVLHYHLLVHDTIPRLNGYREGLYWVDSSRDFVYGIPLILRGELSIGKFLEPYRKRPIFAHESWKDPLPVMKRGKDLFMDWVFGRRTG